jgi:hypothetical protein
MMPFAAPAFSAHGFDHRIAHRDEDGVFDLAMAPILRDVFTIIDVRATRRVS